MTISANLVVSLKAEVSRVEVGSVFEKVDGKRLVTCYFDGYACFRNLCCFSNFYSPFRCSRHVRITHFLVTRTTVKPDFQRGVDVKRRSGSHG